LTFSRAVRATSSSRSASSTRKLIVALANDGSSPWVSHDRTAVALRARSGGALARRGLRPCPGGCGRSARAGRGGGVTSAQAGPAGNIPGARPVGTITLKATGSTAGPVRSDRRDADARRRPGDTAHLAASGVHATSPQSIPSPKGALRCRVARESAYHRSQAGTCWPQRQLRPTIRALAVSACGVSRCGREARTTPVAPYRLVYSGSTRVICSGRTYTT
jgi:hypothetical protein